MRENLSRDVFRAAYTEASLELRTVLGEFERLRIRRDQVENLLEAIKPAIELDGDVVAPYPSRCSHHPEFCTVITEISVVRTTPKI
jgi:hypothetical protein